MPIAYIEEIISAIWLCAGVGIGLIAAVTKEPLWLIPAIGLCLHAVVGFFTAMKSYSALHKAIKIEQYCIDRKLAEIEENEKKR